MSRKNNSGLLVGAILGTAAGLVAGILLAPDEGKETRKKIKRKANDFKDKATDGYHKASDAVKENYHHLADKAKSYYENYKNKAQNIAENIEDDINSELDGLR